MIQIKELDNDPIMEKRDIWRSVMDGMKIGFMIAVIVLLVMIVKSVKKLSDEMMRLNANADQYAEWVQEVSKPGSTIK